MMRCSYDEVPEKTKHQESNPEGDPINQISGVTLQPSSPEVRKSV